MDSPSTSVSSQGAQKRKKKLEDDRPKRQRIATACTACRQRKAKCDGNKPCGSCRQAKLEDCTYPATAKKIDPEYLQQLEKRIEELSGAVSRSQESSLAPKPPAVQVAKDTVSSGALRNTLIPPSVFNRPLVTSRNVSGTTLSNQIRTATGSSYNTSPPDVASNSVEPSFEASRDTLLTLIASPGVNTQFPDSSTRTLFDEVEGATRRLVGGPNGVTASGRTGDRPGNLDTTNNGDAEALHMFTYTKSQQDLYSLPHRQLSDALVAIYRDRIHPIFRILHWPTFMKAYEDTFQAGGSVDKHWLGLLNQVYAIACQIGGPDIEAVQGAEAGLRFFQRSLAMMFPLVLQSRSLQALQCVLLMVQYLQSVSQPNLCWNTVGHAVRFAQSQGLYSASTFAHMNPVEAETRRRVWAGVVAMEATTAATLGLPPSLSARHCHSVEPTPVDDEYVTADGLLEQPRDQPSVASFIQQTYKLYAIQLKILDRLYSPHCEPDSKWPSPHDILDYDGQLEDWAKQVPPHLQYDINGAALRGSNEELNMQTNVLRARFLNAKMLAHRPMLSHLCHRSQSDAHNNSGNTSLDQALTYASARICCSAAMEVLEIVTENWKNGQSGAWWYSLYYVYSSSLVILASFVVDTISSNTAVACVADLPRATSALRAAQLYLSDKPDVLQGLMSPVVNQAARESVRSCHAMLAGIMKTLASNSTSPLKANTSKGDYHAAVRSALDLPLADTVDQYQQDPVMGSGSKGEDPYEDFWTLLSQTRPPSPQPLQQFAENQDSFLGLGPSQPAWPNDFSLDSWQWPQGDYSLQFPIPTFDNAVKAAYSSQPAAPHQFADNAYSEYATQYK